MSEHLTLAQLNALDRDAFVAALAGIYEHSAWVAEAVADRRPFASREALGLTMQEAVDAAPDARKLALLRAHPQLAGRAARRGALTDASQREQRGAGLTDLTAEQLARVDRLNAEYMARFGFPFIIAVRGHTREEIFEHWVRRLDNDAAAERASALAQVHAIAAFRLAEQVHD